VIVDTLILFHPLHTLSLTVPIHCRTVPRPPMLCRAVLCAEGIEYCIVHPYISYPAAAAFVLTAMPGEASRGGGKGVSCTTHTMLVLPAEFEGVVVLLRHVPAAAICSRHADDTTGLSPGCSWFCVHDHTAGAFPVCHAVGCCQCAAFNSIWCCFCVVPPPPVNRCAAAGVQDDPGATEEP
jgi:hypothetical protein